MELKNNRDFKILRIGQIVHSVSETHKFDKERLIAINTSDVLNGVLGKGIETPIEELKGQFKKTIKNNDLLFSEIRPANRRFAKVGTGNWENYVISTKLMVLRKYNYEVDLDYFYYCLTNQPFLETLQRRAENRIGSFPQITFDLLATYAFPIPPIDEQKRIASTISNIDRKIELNKQINDNLEAMAKQLYDYWFVQFDFPNEEGKPYKSSGGAMVWNEKLKREIPQGWYSLPISNVLDKYPTTKRYETKEYLSVGKYPIIDQGDSYIVGFTNEDDNLLTRHPAVLFGDHSTKVKFLDFDFARGADGTQILYSSNEAVSQYYLYLSVCALQIPNPGYSRHFKYLKELPIIIPSLEIAYRFANIVKPLFEDWTRNIFNNIELTKQRDELLPLLMNGQASVTLA
jgi:type I restriction enzyme, S subunit